MRKYLSKMYKNKIFSFAKQMRHIYMYVFLSLIVIKPKP